MREVIQSLRRIANQANLDKVCAAITFDDWDESKHPRGNPKNAGQFAKKGEATATSKNNASSNNGDWYSKAGEARLREGWTEHPQDITKDELWALSAIVPEKHHTGSESHGRDVILTNMYPPNYASTPEAMFVKQFKGDKDALSQIRNALFLLHGGDTHNKEQFAKVSRQHLIDNLSSSLPQVDKQANQKRHDELLSQEREVLAKRQSLQNQLGFPYYKNNDEWKALNDKYNAIHTERLTPPNDEQSRTNAIQNALKELDDSLDTRFAEYKKQRQEKGQKLLDDIADKFGVTRFDDMDKGGEAQAQSPANSSGGSGSGESGSGSGSGAGNATHWRNPHVTPEMDTAYMDAVKKGDTDTAYKMVREAAAKSMPNTKAVDDDGLPLVVYHNSPDKWTEYEGGTVWTWRDWEGPGSSWSFGENQYDLFIDIRNPFEWYADSQPEEDLDFSEYNGEEHFSAAGIVSWAEEKGYDGVIIREVKEFYDRVEGDDFVAFNPSQIKSADPITYDDNGDPIPLSRRFNPNTKDIRE